jgi:hypothetical protein
MPMFSMDDFNKDDDFYNNFDPTNIDMGDFGNVLMTITHMLKNLNYDNYLKSGHDLMMKIFNMTSLDPTDENEQPLNVVMALLSHIYAMLSVNEDRDEYFSYFDQSVIYPMINGGANG